jgi:hypothetical protein
MAKRNLKSEKRKMPAVAAGVSPLKLQVSGIMSPVSDFVLCLPRPFAAKVSNSGFTFPLSTFHLCCFVVRPFSPKKEADSLAGL